VRRFWSRLTDHQIATALDRTADAVKTHRRSLKLTLPKKPLARQACVPRRYLHNCGREPPIEGGRPRARGCGPEGKFHDEFLTTQSCAFSRGGWQRALHRVAGTEQRPLPVGETPNLGDFRSCGSASTRTMLQIGGNTDSNYECQFAERLRPARSVRHSVVPSIHLIRTRSAQSPRGKHQASGGAP
jgi:hypothetical protein